MTNFFIKILSAMISICPVSTGNNLDIAIKEAPRNLNLEITEEITAESILVFNLWKYL